MSKPLLRYNKEYFGYIVGFSNGKIILAKDSAKYLLEKGCTYEELLPHKLEKIDVREGFYLETPPLVWLEITRKCNLKCPHCYIDGGLKREGELSSSEIHNLIDELADIGVWSVAFTGGEPTLHPDLADFVIHARRRNLLVGIATHGLHLSDSFLKKIPTDGVIISISIDNLHIQSVNILRSDEFSVISSTLLRCKDHGFNVNIMTNTNRKNIHSLNLLIDWAEQQNISIRSVPFSPIGDRARQNQQELENTVEDANLAADFWLREVILEHKYHDEVGLCVGAIFNYGLSLAYMTNRCSSARYLGYVASDGVMYPCTSCAGENIFPAGNIKDGGFLKLWKSNWEIRMHSWKNFKDTCNECPLNDEMFYCSSRCPAMSFARHGNFNSCGASDFEKVSLVIRTGMMQNSELREDDIINYSGPQMI